MNFGGGRWERTSDFYQILVYQEPFKDKELKKGPGPAGSYLKPEIDLTLDLLLSILVF